jgi:DNA-binding SARP family transcriptional activator
LALAIWDVDPPPKSAAGQIHSYVSRLRHLLGGAASTSKPRIISERACGYRLDREDGTVDVRVFEAYAAVAVQACAAGRVAAGLEAARLALDLWRGPPLADAGSREFDPVIRKLEQTMMVCRLSMVDAMAALGRIPEALSLVASFTGGGSLDENLHVRMAVFLALSSRVDEAIELLLSLRAAKRSLLGLDLAETTRRVQVALLNDRATLDLIPGFLGRYGEWESSATPRKRP